MCIQNRLGVHQYQEAILWQIRMHLVSMYLIGQLILISLIIGNKLTTNNPQVLATNNKKKLVLIKTFYTISETFQPLKLLFNNDWRKKHLHYPFIKVQYVWKGLFQSKPLFYVTQDLNPRSKGQDTLIFWKKD